MTNKDRLSELTRYLESYKKYRRFMNAARSTDAEPPFEYSEVSGMLDSVRTFVLALPDSTEKLFLYYHYIQGESMERCSEILGVALRSMYRIRLRALNLAADRFFFGKPIGLAV